MFTAGALSDFRLGATTANQTLKTASRSTSRIARKIHVGKQEKHILGHNNYQKGKSVLKADALELLDAFLASKVKASQAIDDVKTRVDFGKNIGDYIDPQTKIATQLKE